MTGTLWRGVLAAFALTACTPVLDVPVRDPAAPLGATTRFDAAAFSGNWQVAARFVSGPPSVLSAVYDPQTAQLVLTGGDLGSRTGKFREGVPGELVPVQPGKERLIVMWIDEDVETAAIGTPSGSYGALLDRDGFVPQDRLQAARDIFEFYGWNVNALVRAGP